MELRKFERFGMDAVKRLFKTKDIYDLKNTDELFVEAVRENFLYHFNNCEQYRKLVTAEKFDICVVKSTDDLYKIPVIPTLFFKSNSMYSTDRIKIKAVSSGTSGKRSEVGFDTKSFMLGLKMVLKTFGYHGLLSVIPTNYIVLNYEPGELGASKTSYGVTYLAPPIRREYALINTPCGVELNKQGIEKAVDAYSHSIFPVRFVGFPAFLYFICTLLKQKGITFKLTRRPSVLIWVGWKQYERVDKRELYKLVEETLGITEANIREFYSAVEHPVCYCDCNRHHFHVPVYSRVIVRDVKTLLPVRNGEEGLLSFVTPFIKSMPLLSIVTDDIAVMHDAAGCGCGIRSPYFEVIKRAGLKDIKTCAAGAAEML